MFSLKLAVAKLAGSVSRLSRRGGGTSLPGKLLLAMDRQAISRMGSRLPMGSVILSATNGKTTTANMIANVLRQDGADIVHNRAGANLESGVASALLYNSSLRAKPRAKLGLFELDEAAMPAVARQLKPRMIVLGNLFRDQLDRYGELEHLADLWAEAVRESTDDCNLVLCADDPLIADLGGEVSSERVSYFGIEDPSQALAKMQHAADSKHCRSCGAAYSYSLVFLGHLGHYACDKCGNRRPKPDIYASDIELNGLDGSSFTISHPGGSVRISLPLPGLYNVYNALTAAAACIGLGVKVDVIEKGLHSFSAAFGRVQKLSINDSEATIFLIKNPAGANEVIRTITAGAAKDLMLMVALNDKIADGRDISWVWDADFEGLSGRADSIVCSGTRATEMALRLKYAGIDTGGLDIESDLGKALDLSLTNAGRQRLIIMPTYTALLELQGLLARRGAVERYWEL